MPGSNPTSSSPFYSAWLISIAKDTAVVCVAFGATLLGIDMNTAQSIRRGTNSPVVSMIQLLVGMALVTVVAASLTLLSMVRSRPREAQHLPPVGHQPQREAQDLLR